jgi:hypothetical protein
MAMSISPAKTIMTGRKDTAPSAPLRNALAAHRDGCAPPRPASVTGCTSRHSVPFPAVFRESRGPQRFGEDRRGYPDRSARGAAVGVGDLAESLLLENDEDPLFDGEQALVAKTIDKRGDRLPGRSHHAGQVLVRQPQG